MSSRFISKLRRFGATDWPGKMRILLEYYWLLKSQSYFKQFLGELGSGSKIIRPLKLDGIHNIFIEERVLIYDQAWLFARNILPDVNPVLRIGGGTVIGHFNHITCVARVTIGSEVLTADRVHISDNTHDYNDIHTPILRQPVRAKGEVAIGDGSWIGEGVQILGCSVGKHCVIGANAVVVNDIPDFSVAAGVPARVIRAYSQQEKNWKRV